MADKARNYTNKELEKMRRSFREIYSEAEEKIQKKIDDFYLSFEKKDKDMRRQLDNKKITKDEYRTWRENQIFIGKKWKKLKSDIVSCLDDSDKDANEYINEKLPEIYSEVYNTKAKDINSDVIGLFALLLMSTKDKNKLEKEKEIVEKNQVKYLNTRDIKIKTLKSLRVPYGKVGPKNTIWNQRRINTQILQGMLKGESMDQIAQRILKLCHGNEAAAMRTARTIVNSVENKARHEAAVEAEKMGCIEVHMWQSAEDDRVRDWHVEADSDYSSLDQAIPLHEPFIVMGEKMMYPGDMSGSPENWYNCRCQEETEVVGFKSILPKDKQGMIRVKGG